MANYLKFGKPLCFESMEKLFRVNAGVKLKRPLMNLSSLTRPPCCRNVSQSTQNVFVPGTSSVSYFNRQRGFLHLSNTPCNRLLAFVNCTNSLIAARLHTKLEKCNLFSCNQDIWYNSSVVKLYALPGTSFPCNSLMALQTFHSGSIQKCTQIRSNLLALVLQRYYSSGAASSEQTDKANENRLNEVKARVLDLVNRLFIGQYNYESLHRKVVFEHNLFGKEKTLTGLVSHALELLRIRLRIHMHFTKTVVEIIKVYPVEKDGVIRIQWRLKAVSQTGLMKALKFTPIDFDCVDACSYFHIDESGLVQKHRIERVMPASK